MPIKWRPPQTCDPLKEQHASSCLARPPRYVGSPRLRLGRLCRLEVGKPAAL